MDNGVQTQRKGKKDIYIIQQLKIDPYCHVCQLNPEYND